MLDASAAVELVLRTPLAERIASRALQAAEQLHAPHLIDIKVAQVLRRLAQSAELAPARAALTLADSADLAIERHAHGLLLRRVWSLRTVMSAYDAAYVALASRAGHTAEIELIAAP